MQNVTHIDSAEEVLSPREAQIQRVTVALRWGIIINGIAALILIFLSLLAALDLIDNFYSTLQSAFLTRHSGPPDEAAATTILFALLNVSLLLVVAIGVAARELWAFAATWLLAIGNIVALVLLGFTPALLTIAITIWAISITGRDISSYRINPVMLKELRGRMRGIRAFVVLTVYLGLMSSFMTLLFLVFSSIDQSQSAAAGQIGRVLFMGIFGIELLLITFIAPAFTAGAITGERERKTYELLRTTLLTDPTFAIGKLESALSYIFLLLLAAIPLQSIAFLFGGISELELILAFVILAVTSIALGAVGVYFSAYAPRTLSASVRSYTVALVATLGAPLLLRGLLNIISSILFNNNSSSAFLEATLEYVELFLISINPVDTALNTQQLLIDQKGLGLWAAPLASNGSTIPLVSPWIPFTIIYLAVSALLVALAIRRMREIEA